MDTAEITIGFACSRKEMVRERIESVHLERHGIDHEILLIAPGRIPEGRDECDLPEYRRMHGLQDASTDPEWAGLVPEGCTSYVARVRLQDAEGGAVTRERIIAIPFGDRDLDFSIDRVGGTQDADAATEPMLPDVVRRALAGDWPTVLRGPEIVDVIILIECGMSADHFPDWREDEWENRTWEPFLEERHVARLATLRITEVREPEHGCAERAHAAYFSTLTTKAPPIIVQGDRLLDGNHRLEAARMRGETHIDAYVIQAH